MLVSLNETINLGAAPEEVWRFLRDTKRLASLVPAVENVARSEGPAEAYTARLTEKVGPFRLSLNMRIRVVEAVEPSLLKVSLKGSDARGANRMTGTLSAALKKAEPGGTLVGFDVSVEVLGKLASLGAGPIRQRARERFDEFAAGLERELSPSQQNQVRVAP